MTDSPWQPPTRPLLLDGATGTELDRRGVPINLPLWSAMALIDSPDAVRAVHEAYISAGADAITTATFRTQRRTLERAGLAGGDAKTLTSLAVDLARDAGRIADGEALVLGSVAPLEDCYRPELAPDGETCRREHTEHMEHLLDAGADMILIETMNNGSELRAATDVARDLAPGLWIVSMCLRHDGPPGHLLSGETLESIGDGLEGAAAVGVNCVSAPTLATHLPSLRNAAGKEVPLAAYANVGHARPDGSWQITDATAPDAYARYAEVWLDQGVRLVGGCCGTTAATIAAVRSLLDRR